MTCATHGLLIERWRHPQDWRDVLVLAGPDGAERRWDVTEAAADLLLGDEPPVRWQEPYSGAGFVQGLEGGPCELLREGPDRLALRVGARQVELVRGPWGWHLA